MATDQAQLIERLRKRRGAYSERNETAVLLAEAADALEAAVQEKDGLTGSFMAAQERALLAEAERDRLAAELAELRKEADALPRQGS